MTLFWIIYFCVVVIMFILAVLSMVHVLGLRNADPHYTSEVLLEYTPSWYNLAAYPVCLVIALVEMVILYSYISGNILIDPSYTPYVIVIGLILIFPTGWYRNVTTWENIKVLAINLLIYLPLYYALFDYWSGATL